jgi:hypothetical protein
MEASRRRYFVLPLTSCFSFWKPIATCQCQRRFGAASRVLSGEVESRLCGLSFPLCAAAHRDISLPYTSPDRYGQRSSSTVGISLLLCRTRTISRSFSKKRSNHTGAIKYFICDYNLTKSAALPG